MNKCKFNYNTIESHLISALQTEITKLFLTSISGQKKIPTFIRQLSIEKNAR